MRDLVIHRTLCCSRSNTQLSVEHLTTFARELLTRVYSGEIKLPMLPNVAQELFQISASPHLSLREIETTIAREPILAAKVVAVAGSALYGGSRPLESLHLAAMRLGQVMLRQLIAQVVAESYLFTGPFENELEVERRHALAVGFLARKANTLIKVPQETAFLCGLLHDIGRPIAWAMIHSEMERSLTTEQSLVLVDLLHPIIGERVARQWGLPEVVAEVARFHHCYRGDSKRLPHNEMVVMIAACDRLAKSLMKDREVDRSKYQGLREEACEALGLDEAKLGILEDYANTIVASL